MFTAALRRVCLFLPLLAIASNTADSVTLSWRPSPSDSVVAYHVYCGTGSNQSSVVIPNQTTTQIDGLVPGTTYYFLVTALDAAGVESRPSNEVVFTVPTNGDSSSSPAAGLSNISARAEVLTPSSAIIGGFVIGGTDSHTVVVRGLGPTLSSVGVAGVLADPFLALHQTDAQGNDHVLASNDNWRDTQESAINSTGLAPPNDAEAAIILSLPPGSYSAVLTGANGSTGVGLIEVYDLSAGGPLLFNVSTRGFVGVDDHVLIGGFIAGGENTRVIVRALGPSLQQFGVTGTLADPMLILFDSNGNVVASNDDWADDYPTDIQYASYAPPNPSESAIIIDRPPGNTTAVVRGKNGGTGIGLVEVYYVP